MLRLLWRLREATAGRRGWRSIPIARLLVLLLKRQWRHGRRAMLRLLLPLHLTPELLLLLVVVLLIQHLLTGLDRLSRITVGLILLLLVMLLLLRGRHVAKR